MRQKPSADPAPLPLLCEKHTIIHALTSCPNSARVPSEWRKASEAANTRVFSVLHNVLIYSHIHKSGSPDGFSDDAEEPFPRCRKASFMAQDMLFHSPEQPLQACWRAFFSHWECENRMIIHIFPTFIHVSATSSLCFNNSFCQNILLSYMHACIKQTAPGNMRASSHCAHRHRYFSPRITPWCGARTSPCGWRKAATALQF